MEPDEKIECVQFSADQNKNLDLVNLNLFSKRGAVICTLLSLVNLEIKTFWSWTYQQTRDQVSIVN